MLLSRKLFSQFSHAHSIRHIKNITSRSSECRRLFHATTLLKDKEKNGIDSNPYYEKYAGKISQVQKDGIYNAPKEDRLLYEEMEKWKRDIGMVERKVAEKAKEKDNTRGSILPKNLDDLIHMDLLKSKSIDEITHIWKEYFKDKNCISSVIPSDVFDRKMLRAKECPVFLYPLPKSNGYEFILSQFDNTRCFYSSLINYQVHSENAPWQLCMTYYSEFKEDKGIVLMVGEFDKNAMNVLEAQCLVQLQQMFYASSDNKYYNLVMEFNHHPEQFKHMHLIDLVEGSNLIVKPLNDV